MNAGFGKSIGFVAGGIGDQIYHLTQLRALASASTNKTIDIACINPRPIHTLLANSPWAGSIIDARPLRRYLPGLRGGETIDVLRQKNYDSAFILHRSTSFKLAAAVAKIPRRVGLYGQHLDRLLLTTCLPAGGGGARRALWGHRPFIAAADAFIDAQGLALDDSTPTIMPNPAMMTQVQTFLERLPRPITIVNLFAADLARRWPIEHANTVLTALANDIGGSFILNAGPDAAHYHDAMLAAWCGPHTQLIDSLKHDPSMARDIALYHAADLYVGVDSFTANLAFNCNLPAVVLFAKAGDVLGYKPAIAPLFPAAGSGLASLHPVQVSAAAKSLLPPQQGGRNASKTRKTSLQPNLNLLPD